MNDPARAEVLRGGWSDVETYPRNAWFNACVALIRLSPPLWLFCWPLLLVCEAQGEAMKRRPVAIGVPPPACRSATVIDLAEWRSRHHASAADRTRVR